MHAMIRVAGLLTVASLLCGVPQLQAQGGGSGSSKTQTVDPKDLAEAQSLDQENPMGFILDHATDFNLADTQITKLSALKAQVERENGQLKETLDSILPPGTTSHVNYATLTTEQRDSLISQRKAIAAIRLQMRDNSRKAREAAMAALTPAQQRIYTNYVSKMRGVLEDAAMTGQAGPGGTPLSKNKPPH